jgi:hypothetical protein
VTYENIAYLIMDMASDFKSVSEQLAQVAQGELGLEPSRVKYSARCLREARQSLDACLAQLERISPQSPS